MFFSISFFFKQNAAYEILALLEFRRVLFRSVDDLQRQREPQPGAAHLPGDEWLEQAIAHLRRHARDLLPDDDPDVPPLGQMGRASCRESVEILVGVVSLKKSNIKHKTDYSVE